MKATLDKALPHLLRPLVRLCVRYAVKVVDVEAVLKVLFVQEAQRILAEQGEIESVSKISVMTGLQRMSINNILLRPEPGDALPGTSLMMKVLGMWQSDSMFMTNQGSPRILQYEGKQSEFAQLVSSVSRALNPYTVLFELERAQVVKKTARGLKLLSRSFLSNQNAEIALQFLSSDLADLTAAVEENMTNKTTPVNHHLTTEFDNIPEQHAAEVKYAMLKEGERFHSRLRTLLTKYDRDSNRDRSTARGATMRVTLCSFSRCEMIKQEGGVLP